MHEFLFSEQPILQVVAVLSAICLVQDVGEAANLVARGTYSAARVFSHPAIAGNGRDNNVRTIAVHDTSPQSTGMFEPPVVLTRDRTARPVVTHLLGADSRCAHRSGGGWHRSPASCRIGMTRSRPS